jgi:surface protein
MSDVRQIKDTINVEVVNNTAFVQNVNLLGGTSDPLGVPPHLLYQWDLSTETYFGSVTAEIVISSTANPTPVTYTVQINGYNIEAVAFALNGLKLGVFQVSGDIIYVSNDFYIYGNLSVNSSAFVSTWNTTLLSGGSSASNQIKLPLVSVGVYNFVVDWGDGTQDTITSWNQPEALHTYAVAGIKTVQLLGTIIDFSFGLTPVSDENKILSISAWGLLQFGVNASSSFLSCVNLNLTAVSDVPDLSLSTDFSNCFSNYSFATINRIDEWDISNVALLDYMFDNALTFNQSINSWNTSNVTSMRSMFGSCSSFNQNLNSWDTSSVTDMSLMFSNATSFNGNISSWDTRNVQTMLTMFSNATAFNQIISNWNVRNVLDFNNFMAGKSFTNYLANYLDAIYNTWSTLPIQPNLTISFGTIKYTVAGQAGKNVLDFAPNNWTITDGGI